jgi:teichuronic acid biosynthesis glycosyltransferase TuaG
VPRVSVIIPAFNAEAHIAEALQSVRAQSYDDWEVVIADDCSIDSTVAIAETFGERVTVVQATANAGPATARNRAIEESSGELLAFLDADDYWLPSYLEQQVSLYDEGGAERGRIGIVACNARLLTPSGFAPGTYMDLVEAPEEVTLVRLLSSNPIFVGALSPQAVIAEAGGFCDGILAEDYDLWIRIVELGYRVLSNRRPLAVYRIRPHSLSADPAPMVRALQNVYRRALARGNLAPRERRVAARELRRWRAHEHLAAARRGAYIRAFRAIPLFVLVAAERPDRWPSYVRGVAHRRRAPSAFRG